MALMFAQWRHLVALGYMRPITVVATAGLNAVGIPAQLELGTLHLGFCLIEMPGVDFRVIHDCMGVFTLGIYLAVVMAFPIRLSSKLSGAAIGFALFFLLQFSAPGRPRHLG